MTATTERAIDVAGPGLLARYESLPGWARWSLMATVGLIVMSLVRVFGKGGPDLLTSTDGSGVMLRFAAPILLAGLGGLFAERAGIVNIGLEGMMILGTWSAAWGGINYGPWWGIAFGALGGALGGLLHAIATVGFGVNHIISGVAINIMAPGVVRYLSDEIFSGYEGGSVSQSPSAGSISKIDVPFLAGGDVAGWSSPDILGWFEDRRWIVVADLAGIARGFVYQVSWFTILVYALVPLSAWILWRTRFGLRVRSAGERPQAGESLGVDIYRYQYVSVVVSGALAGMGGAFIVIELTGFYRQGQTTNRGFIGLAALIFGNWRPAGVLVGALVFGYPFGLSLRDLGGSATHNLLLLIAVALAAVLSSSLMRSKRVDAILAGTLGSIALVWYAATKTAPDWLPNTMPYVMVLLVLIFASQRLRMPAADGQVYRRGRS